jgi:SAM-dependent methyltransferase
LVADIEGCHNIGVKSEEYSTMFEVEDAHWWHMGHRRLYASLLDRYCPQASRARVLDAGCGTGGLTQWFSENFHPSSLHGIEISEDALAYCRKRGLEGVRCCSVEDIPFPDGSFDLVMCLNVLYHREVANDLDALREIARVLAPGGYLLLNLPALRFLRGKHDQAVEGVRRYRAGELKRLLSEVRLEPVRITYFNFFLLPALAIHRLLGRKRYEDDARSDLWLPPRPVNRALESLLALESRLAACRLIPIGSSLTALARKPLRLLP